MTLNFGKYKGKDVATIPTSYLTWLYENAYSDKIRIIASEVLLSRSIASLTPQDLADAEDVVTFCCNAPIRL